MDELIKNLNFPLIFWAVGALAVLVVSLFTIAFFQDRPLTFWPPKIGSRPKSVEAPAAKASPHQVATSIRTRSVEGIWACQYTYPVLDKSLGRQITQKETQVILLEQEEDRIKGRTILALTHPETLEGRLSGNRYLTGTYFNRLKNHTYHGAFQFVCSLSRNRMMGKWVGFGHDGTAIDCGDWRWEQLEKRPVFSSDDLPDFMSRAVKIDFFAIDEFL